MRLRLKKVHEAIEKHFYTPPVLELFARSVSIVYASSYTVASQFVGINTGFGSSALKLEVSMLVNQDILKVWSDAARDGKLVNINLRNASSFDYQLMDVLITSLYIQHDWMTNEYMLHMTLNVDRYTVE